MQDSGYLARAAFLGDRFMQLMGLHGNHFFTWFTVSDVTLQELWLQEH
jgi:Fe2+ transport system protein B